MKGEARAYRQASPPGQGCVQDVLQSRGQLTSTPGSAQARHWKMDSWRCQLQRLFQPPLQQRAHSLALHTSAVYNHDVVARATMLFPLCNVHTSLHGPCYQELRKGMSPDKSCLTLHYLPTTHACSQQNSSSETLCHMMLQHSSHAGFTTASFFAAPHSASLLSGVTAMM
jgi:hypothetical protein